MQILFLSLLNPLQHAPHVQRTQLKKERLTKKTIKQTTSTLFSYSPTPKRKKGKKKYNSHFIRYFGFLCATFLLSHYLSLQGS